MYHILAYACTLFTFHWYYRYDGISLHQVVVCRWSPHNWSVRYEISIYNRRCNEQYQVNK